MDDEKLLVKKLFKDYDKNIVPQINSSTSLNVTFEIVLQNIINVVSNSSFTEEYLFYIKEIKL